VKGGFAVAWRRAKVFHLGRHELAMLALSNFVIFVTGGMSYLWQLYRVYVVAKTTPTTTATGPWIVVLGMHLRDGAITADYVSRLERAWTLQATNPNSRIMVVGGRKAVDGRTEAAEGRAYLLARGIVHTCVLPDDQSANTLENLRQVRAMIGDSPSQPAVLISNRYHLARIRAMAIGLNLSHTLCAAEARLHLHARVIARLLQEAYYLHWVITGRAWSWLTEPGTRRKAIR
jgi:uncharacterized SAM-binding protein YcdF (DUF218 family)